MQPRLGSVDAKLSKLVEALDHEYDPEVGFIGLARNGQYDVAGLERLRALLGECPSADVEAFPADLIRLLWWIPWVLEWQAQRLEREARPSTDMRNALNAVFSDLERILGVP